MTALWTTFSVRLILNRVANLDLFLMKNSEPKIALQRTACVDSYAPFIWKKINKSINGSGHQLNIFLQLNLSLNTHNISGT